MPAPSIAPAAIGTNKLNLSLLGGFAARDGAGKQIEITSKKNRALLTIVALSPEMRITRERLANLLWSDRDDVHARSSLRQALAILRKEVGEELLDFSGETVSLLAGHVYVDAIDFLQAAKAQDTMTLRRAAELYHGELVAGLAVSDASFEDWLASERSLFREAAIQTLGGLARIENGPAQIAVCQRLLSLDPLREESHRMLMRAYASSGENGLALRQFDICKAILQQELGVEPAKETQDLRKKIMTRQTEVASNRNNAAATMTSPITGKPSIAVLPFENMSDDPKQEYFADGVVDELITALSRFQQLFVVSRNSSFVYKGRMVDVKDIGQELGVRYLLEGSVRKANERVRITGQLVDAETGAHLWADRFEGNHEDIFNLQDQVTVNVVGAIFPKLEQAEIERSRRKPTDSLDAYDYFLRGMAAYHLWKRETNKEAFSMFTRAIELDPDFASAYAMAARCYAQEKAGGWPCDRVKATSDTARLARRAAELDNGDALSLSTAGFAIAWVSGEVEYGNALIERALKINPNLPYAWNFSAWAKVWLGQPEVAIDHAARAMHLSPNDPQMVSMQTAMATAHLFCHRYAEAWRWSEMVVQRLPNYGFPICVAAASAALANKAEEAISTMTHLRELMPEFRVSKLLELFPIRRSADAHTFAEGLRKAGLPE